MSLGFSDVFRFSSKTRVHVCVSVCRGGARRWGGGRTHFGSGPGEVVLVRAAGGPTAELWCL